MVHQLFMCVNVVLLPSVSTEVLWESRKLGLKLMLERMRSSSYRE